MAKLVYGNGICEIDGSNIRGVLIIYRGNIEIDDKTGDSFAIKYKDNKIIIFPVGSGYLNNLFNYIGEFKITGAYFVDDNAERVPAPITKQLHHADQFHSNAEDITLNSEDLNVGYVHGKKVGKTSMKGIL
tara:strand:- start:703 stop:1095 length:393 start_codon:yes stop_codon:yes gene_type:complete